MREPIDVIIHRTVFRVTGISEVLVKTQTRKQAIVMARHLTCYLFAKWSNLTLNEIAFMVKRKDHSTVVNSRRFCQNAIDTNDKFATTVALANKMVEMEVSKAFEIIAPAPKEIYITVNPLLT